MLFRRPARWLVAAVLALAPALAQTPATPPAVTPTPTPATEVIRRPDLVAEYFAADPAKASPVPSSSSEDRRVG